MPSFTTGLCFSFGRNRRRACPSSLSAVCDRRGAQRRHRIAWRMGRAFCGQGRRPDACPSDEVCHTSSFRILGFGSLGSSLNPCSRRCVSALDFSRSTWCPGVLPLSCPHSQRETSWHLGCFLPPSGFRCRRLYHHACPLPHSSAALRRSHHRTVAWLWSRRGTDRLATDLHHRCSPYRQSRRSSPVQHQPPQSLRAHYLAGLGNPALDHGSHPRPPSQVPERYRHRPHLWPASACSRS